MAAGRGPAWIECNLAFRRRFPKTSNPRPGDLYFKPLRMGQNGKQDVQHIGFVKEPNDPDPGLSRQSMATAVLTPN
jgi:hypothetical protein